MDITRIENLHRADDILQLIKTKYADNPPSISIKINRKFLEIIPDRPEFDETDIEIENIDTITSALKAIKDGYRPLILNMANAYRPGGGFLTGAKAQEEDLFRCTDLSATLTFDLYPMHGCEIIYTAKAHILKDVEYKDLDAPVEVGIVSVAAHTNPQINEYGMIPQYIYDQTMLKIRMIFHLGMIQRYDCLILGALGCGAFNNPPHEIAQIFCSVSEEYAQKFDKIIFPILSGSDNSNCDVFQSAFLEAFNKDEKEQGNDPRSRDRRRSNDWVTSDYDTDTDTDLDWRDSEVIDQDPHSDQGWTEWFMARSPKS